MVIYDVIADFDKYKVCVLDMLACMEAKKNSSDPEFMIFAVGEPLADKWWPRAFTLKKSRKKLGNLCCSNAGSYLILDHPSVEKLKPVLGNAEILPLNCDFGDYWCVNIIDVVDCIDYENSDYTPIHENEYPPRFSSCRKLAFLPEKLAGHHLFKNASQRGYMYADDVFVEAVKKNKITGFKFIPVWEG